MAYENAPATRMIAAECACCARPLVDSVSVETGMGPVCREKHGYFEPSATEESRKAANAIVHRIACAQTGPTVAPMIAALHALGFRTLAARIAKRLGAIHVTRDADGALAVKAPFSEAFNASVRRCRGQRWVADRKVRRVPPSERAELWAALKASYPRGTVVFAPDRVAVL